MQTFLPYPDFARSAASLDRVRLGKQRVETLQILRALVIPDYGWRSHPAVRMWMGHVPALTRYGLAMADEWVRRGGRDSTRANILEFAPQVDVPKPANLAAYARVDAAMDLPSEVDSEAPGWLGDPELHRSHRSNLIRKDPDYYGAQFPGEAPGLEYVWPEPARVLLPREPGPDRIWILRMATGGQLESGEHFGAGLFGGDHYRGHLDPANPDRWPAGVHLAKDAANGRRSPKRQRQVQAFLDCVDIGQRIAVPVENGRRFISATVSGPAEEQQPGILVRPVEVGTLVDRDTFGYPALLQDPRVFFAVPAPLTA
ncbi:MAG TPA: MSMEG_6728 family protein [Micrococcaceae bacterium]